MVKVLNSPEQIENHRKRLLIITFAVLGSVFLSSFGILSLLGDHFYLGVVLLFFLVTVIAIAVKAKNIEHVQRISIFLSTILFSLAIYLLVNGGNQGTGAYWTYPIVMLMILLVGPKVGLAFTLAYSVLSAVLIFGNFEFVYNYPEVHKVRISAATVSLLVLIIASEWIRFSSYSAISAISKAHQNLANTDALTKVLNRHGLQHALPRKAFKQNTVIALIDADSFKSLNDNYGHDFGDQVLITLANIIRQNVKGADLIARWGGEEFLLILFDTHLHDAEALVEKIKYKFSSFTFIHKGEKINCTFSAGMSNFESAEEFEQSLKKADERLYKAKEAGRNIVLAT
ncbi:GGDEF domain-containing protein [Alteromonas ponticola]|uniref:diguanylate cyclase n=1 Tax=Alteromonas ponticola TaxID=2720613 RepID=A0ABX1R107_9ALTE|nr:diguanylate cyclase [Alteromonas ponticola]NMH59136.1 diguanylate cyclase [Alteromonas ponticola]